MKYIRIFLILLCLFAPFYIGVDTVYADSNTVTDDDTVYRFEFQEPKLDSNSMYIVYLLESIENPNFRQTALQYVNIIPRYTTDSDEYDWADDVFFQVNFSSTVPKIYFNTSSTTNARAYSVMMNSNGALWSIGSLNENFTTQTNMSIDFQSAGYKVVGYEIIGGNYHINTGIASKVTFTYLFADEYTQYNALLDIIQEIALNNEISADEIELLSSILSQLQSDNDVLTTIKNILNSVQYDVDQLEYYLDLIYKNVNNIYNKVDNIEEYTDDIEYYLDLIYTNCNNILNNVDDVEDKLQEIIDLFTPTEGEEDKYPSPDTGSQIELEMKGDQLTNTDTTNQQQDLKIEVNTNASSYIWTLFNDYISSNGKVIGMYITLLSCAFIALILGR